jgi:hypothetical protein
MVSSIQLIVPAVIHSRAWITYDAFGGVGAIFRELEWEMVIFYERVVPKTPNASCARPRRRPAPC